jgi:hypothetical protein
MNVSDAIKSLKPDAQFSIVNEDIENIIWISDDNIPKKEEIIAEKNRLILEYQKTEYQRLRQPKYPSLADLADAIYWQSKGDDSKMVAYLQACEDVKNQYPKPEDNNG